MIGLSQEKLYIVYVHINKINGKRYVGITNQKPEYRWRSDGSGYFRSPHFWNAIQEYGWDNFEHTILEEGLARSEACEKEKHYIELYQTRDRAFGYNMTNGGDGSCGWTPSEETLKKRSEKLKGKVRSLEQRRRLSESLRGKEVSEETRRRLREAHLGKKLTGHALEATRERLIKMHERQKKKVYCIDSEGRRTDFDSIKEAATFYNEKNLLKNFKRIAAAGKILNGRQWFYEEV